MLRSLIKRNPQPRVGIALGTDTVAASGLVPAPDGWRVRWSRHRSLPFRLFTDQPDAHMTEALANALMEVAPEAAQTCGPVHVALPDTGASVAVFEFDELPEGESVRIDLARGRFEHDRHLDGSSLACRVQPLGTDNGKHLLYASAVDARWLACLTEAMRSANIVPWVIDTAAAFHFSRIDHRLASAAGSRAGAMTVVNHHSWTLLAWDRARRPRLVRSRRCATAEATPADVSAASREIERLIQAYVRGDDERAVEQFYLDGRSPLAEQIGTDLAARNPVGLTRIDLLSDLTLDAEPDPAVRGAVVAAVGR